MRITLGCKIYFVLIIHRIAFDKSNEKHITKKHVLLADVFDEETGLSEN